MYNKMNERPPQQEIHTNDRQQVIDTNAQYFDNKKVACIEH